MEEQNRKIGLIGLGSMGSNIAEVLLKEGYSLVVYNRSSDRYARFSGNGNVYCAKDLATVAEKLQESRRSSKIWLMLPGGEPTNDTVSELSQILNKKSIIIDGSNSEYSDSVKNYKELKKKGISYLDVGVAGGPDDVLKGVALMVGGDRNVFENMEPVLKTVSGSGSYGYVGSSGNGHMLKAVHNSIFYATFPIYAEAAALLMDIQKENKENITESLRLLSVSPPITTGIPAAILKAFRNGKLSKEHQDVTVSKMVSSFVKDAGKQGTQMNITKDILDNYPAMRDGTKHVYIGAKKILTGH